MRLLVENIGLLVGGAAPSGQPLRGNDMARLHILENAWLLAEDGRIATLGYMCAIPSEGIRADVCVDARGGAVLPSWCDPHTHIVYAGSREAEFADKIRGLSYAEIARVIQRIKESAPLRVVATFLGAHAVPSGMGREEYVDLIVREMLPEVGRGRLADFVDVFCDEGFFTPADTARILDAAARWGLRPKVHVDELAATGGLPIDADRIAFRPESPVQRVAADGRAGFTALHGTYVSRPTFRRNISHASGIVLRTTVRQYARSHNADNFVDPFSTHTSPVLRYEMGQI